MMTHTVTYMRIYTHSIHTYLYTQVDEVSVYIPIRDITLNRINFLTLLRSIPTSEILRKQHAIAALAPTLQYSIIPSTITSSLVNKGEIIHWKPPFKDANDIIIEHILNRSTMHPIYGYTDDELGMQLSVQKQLMLTHADYAALRPIESNKTKTKNNSNSKSYRLNNTSSSISSNRNKVTKLLTCRTIHYPPSHAVELAKSFIPLVVLRNKYIIEYARNGSHIRYANCTPDRYKLGKA